MKCAYLALASVLIGSAAAQVIGFGSCPNVTVKQDFDAKKFAGKWYEAKRYFSIFELGGKCTTATYTPHENGTIGVLNEQISMLTGRLSSIAGYATPNTNEKAKLSVVFPSIPFQFKSPYWVVDTDYDSFAVIWSCLHIPLLNTKFVWVLTREQEPDESVLDKACDVLDKHKINKSRLRVTDQKKCSKDSKKDKNSEKSKDSEKDKESEKSKDSEKGSDSEKNNN